MGSPNLLRFFLHLTLLFACGLRHSVLAQYKQDYVKQMRNGVDVYFFQPTTSIAIDEVIDLGPENLVVLIYNCYHMRDICTNVRNFKKTSRGKNLHPLSKIELDRFGFDFNPVRKEARRKANCPKTWKDHHPCPETDQQIPMRHDGPWFTSALEPGTKINTLQHLRDANNNIIRESRIRYTCDEYPPATWVEGGNGDNGDQPGETRCAAMQCMKRTKAEQDWQATSHNVLRLELKRIAGARASSARPLFNNDDSVIFFKHFLSMDTNGIAAKVVTYDSTMQPWDTTKIRPVKQGFRRRGAGQGPRNETIDRILSKGLWNLSYEELMVLVNSNIGTAVEHHIHANHTHTQFSVVTPPQSSFSSLGMQIHDDGTTWDDGDDEEQEATDGDIAGLPSDPSKFVQRRARAVPRAAASRQIHAHLVAPLIKRATAQDLAKAKTVVSQAVADSARRNGQRMARPLRRVYGLRPGTKIGSSQVTDTLGASINSDVTPLLHVTEDIAGAAALVAEAEARDSAFTKNMTVVKRAPAVGTYWMQGLARKGTVPWGNNASYVVFRNVLDFGAVGDGVTDDTKAINNAMLSGGRCGEKCNGSTTKDAIVYFPPGKYLISSSVLMPFGTQVIGDAIQQPTLIASKSFVGLGVLSTDAYTGGNGGAEEYYINTANFYRQIRNIAIDITGAGVNISCLHYQVAQATSLQNVELIASTDPAKNQIGMFAENGSGGQISDVTFTGGTIGFYGRNQQFTAQRLVFRNCRIGVHVIWDWGWVWKSVTMTNVDVGFRLAAIDSTGNIGSVSIMDSSFRGIHSAAVVIGPPSETVGGGSTGLVLENVALSGVTATVVDTAGKVYLDGSSAVVRSWVIGTTYEGNATARGFSHGGPVGDHRRNAGLLDSTGAYFERAKPQYEDNSVGDFVHIKDLGATGDGSTDDTAAFQAAMYASLGKILFIDAGSYILTSTIVIPPGAKIVGETWSQLVASGPYFSNANKPQVLIKVGEIGSVGSVEMQDLLFTTRGPTAGVVLVEWNIQAEKAGSAALWDCHARIGGATGTQLTPAECPASTTGNDDGCSAASLMMRLTSKASGYFENMWLWGADHMIDDPDLSDSANDMEQCSVYVARGFLIESTNPTWLYGTASEHSVLYQYNFQNAANIFAGMLQTESPYFQPTPPPPAPFGGTVGLFPGDPTFICGHESAALTGCGDSWSTIIQGCQNVYIAAAGVYSWFSTYAQTCIDKQECQGALVQLKNNKANVRIQNLVTIGATNMAVMDGQGISAANNLNVNTHPFWSLITILDVGHNGSPDFTELVWIDPVIWSMAQPSFTCVPPCHVQLPPFPGSTSTVDYPLMTVSSGTWTSTITQAPITISEWVLEVVTIVADDAKHKRDMDVQGFTPFRPKAATTPYWPAIAYTGPNGERTTTSPSGAFPTPNVIIDKDVKPWQGLNDTPTYEPCKYLSFNCIIPPWMIDPGSDGDNGDDDGGGDDGYDNPRDLDVRCPVTTRPKPIIVSPTTTSSSSSSTTTSTTIPLPSGDSTTNRVDCYNSGETTENQRMLDAATYFCNGMAHDTAIGPGYRHSDYLNFKYNGGVGYVRIVMSLYVYPNCTWTYNEKECQRYLDVPDDSCNCATLDKKQGGYVRNNCYEWRIDPNRAFNNTRA